MPQILDFVAQSYQSHSRPLNAARCVNFFAEVEEQDAKSKAPVGVWGAPGIAPFVDLGQGPVKALNVMNSQLYAVAGNALFKVNADGTFSSMGAQYAADLVSIDNNGVQLCWVDGSSGWYCTAGGSPIQITDPNFFPSNTVTYFDGYFVFVRNGTKEFFLSPLFGVEPFDGALFASKEATSDQLLAIANSHEQLYLFGQQRIEIWFDAGNPPPTFPFQRSDGAIIQRGLLAPLSVVLEDNTLFFLGDDGMFYKVKGFIPERISNHAVESEWSKYQKLTDAKALVYTIFGHKMVTLTFPQAQKTWVCDLATRRWHERESWIGTSADDSIGRWRVNCAIMAYDRVLVGDSQTGRIGQLTSEAYTEWGNTMRGLLDGPPIHNDRRRMFMKRFEIDVESGVGLNEAAHEQTLQYCANPVVITAPSQLTNTDLTGLDTNYPSAVFSVWLNLSDGDATGIILINTGLRISIDTSTIAVQGIDGAVASVFNASYTFTNWADWVNVMVSFDTTTQQLQVWANTLVAGVLVETELTADTLTWSSRNPLCNPGTGSWVLEVAPAP